MVGDAWGFDEFGRSELRVKRIRRAVSSLHLILLRPGTGAFRGKFASCYAVFYQWQRGF